MAKRRKRIFSRRTGPNGWLVASIVAIALLAAATVLADIVI